MSQNTETKTEEDYKLASIYETAIEYYSQEHQKEVLAAIDRGHQIRAAFHKVHEANWRDFHSKPSKAELDSILAEFNISPEKLEQFLEKSRQHWKEVDERVEKKLRDEAAMRAFTRLMEEKRAENSDDESAAEQEHIS